MILQPHPPCTLTHHAPVGHTQQQPSGTAGAAVHILCAMSGSSVSLICPSERRWAVFSSPECSRHDNVLGQCEAAPAVLVGQNGLSDVVCCCAMLGLRILSGLTWRAATSSTWHPVQTLMRAIDRSAHLVSITPSEWLLQVAKAQQHNGDAWSCLGVHDHTAFCTGRWKLVCIRCLHVP
jgi:hypothetical protein